VTGKPLSSPWAVIVAVVVASCGTVPRTVKSQAAADPTPRTGATITPARATADSQRALTSSAAGGPAVRVNLPAISGSFADQLRLQAAVATWLESQGGFEVLPLAEVNLVAERAVRGERLSDGEPCGMPAPASAALGFVYPRALIATISEERPFGESVLAVEVPALAAAASPLLYETVPIPEDATVDQIIAALPGLTATHPPEGLSRQQDSDVVPVPGRQDVSVTSVWFRGAWGKDKPKASIFEPDGRSLDHCFQDSVRKDSWNRIRLEVSSSGSVTACEPADPWIPKVPGHDCLCGALSTVSLGAGATGRTATLSVKLQPKRVRAASGRYIWAAVRQIRAEDQTVLWPGPEVPTATISACFAGQDVPGLMSLSVRWWLDARGHVEAVEIDRGDDLSAPVLTCVEKALRGSRFTCPQAGKASRVDVELNVGTTAG